MFVLIKGAFHLVDHNAKGTLTGFEPDGDSIQFKPNDPSLLKQLKRLQLPVRLTAIGSTQLRFEGIDALELHYKPTHGGPYSNQPRPLADNARDFLTGRLGLNPVPYAPPKNIRVKPPVPHDAAPGYILARSLEIHGRPVAFAYAGHHPGQDGSQINVTASVLRRSLNYQLALSGQAYPLFYDTLFLDLIQVFTTAVKQARLKRLGIWRADRSTRGLAVVDQAGLEQNGVTFPKLFRRLTDFLAETDGKMANFLPWLAAKDEQVEDLQTMHITHFDNMLIVKGNTVRLKVLPERLRFISEK